MGAESEPECGDETEAAYVHGLREFFASHGLRWGEPEDLIALAARVAADGSLQEALGARLRAIVRCEGEQLGRGLLMRMVVVAGGGPAVTLGLPELQESLWQIAGWVRTAFQEVGSGVGHEPLAAPERAPGEVVPAADTEAPPVVAEPAAPPNFRERAGEGASSVVSPRRGFRSWLAVHTARRQGPARAGGTGAGRRSRLRGRLRGTWQGTRTGWIVPALAFLAAAGVLVYLVWPSSSRPVVALSEAGAASVTLPGATAGRAGAASQAAEPRAFAGPRACVGPIREGVSRAGIKERSLWAHKLLEGKLYALALPQLRGLEAVNPGFPGVALDESEALLGMGQLNGARGMADAQVRTSACLGGLPSAAVDIYCGEEFSPGEVGGCRQVMARVQAAAELQAARVHLEVANAMQADERLVAALAELTKAGAATAPWEKPLDGPALRDGAGTPDVSPGVEDLRAAATADEGRRLGRGRRRFRRTSLP